VTIDEMTRDFIKLFKMNYDFNLMTRCVECNNTDMEIIGPEEASKNGVKEKSCLK